MIDKMYHNYGDDMKLLYKIDKSILIYILLFIIISIVSIYNAEKLLLDVNHYYIKQIIWYIIGFGIIFLLLKFKNNFLYKYIWFFYIVFNILLLLLLFIASPINEAKCWFTIKGIGTVQPSEFMKIVLIILNSKLISEYKEKYQNPTLKEEFFFLMKIFLILLPPSILTFLEPDTGVVIIYFLITLIMLFASNIRIRWFIILLSIIFIIAGSVIGIYFLNENLFINLFGNSFFLRINRLLDWSNKSGYQLENSITSIASAGLFGHGFNLNIYFPEPQTDFIFAVYSSMFGLVGSMILIFLLSLFDIKLVKISKNCKDDFDRYIVIGIVGMLIYQQFQNISMTFGLLPITGITLPFISYGGSSLLSYMIMIGIILNITKKTSL